MLQCVVQVRGAGAVWGRQLSESRVGICQARVPEGHSSSFAPKREWSEGPGDPSWVRREKGILGSESPRERSWVTRTP